MPLDWVSITEQDWRNRAQPGKEMTIIWTGQFYPSTKFRKATISSLPEWREFADGTLLPQCKTGGWDIFPSENFTLVERAKKPFDPPRSLDDKSILTAFHSIMERRLIADGMKRALTWEKASSEGKEIPVVSIVEAYGPQIHFTFAADFPNIIANFWRR